MNVRRRSPRPDPHVRVTPVWNPDLSREQLARVLALITLHRVEHSNTADLAEGTPPTAEPDTKEESR